MEVLLICRRLLICPQNTKLDKWKRINDSVNSETEFKFHEAYMHISSLSNKYLKEFCCLVRGKSSGHLTPFHIGSGLPANLHHLQLFAFFGAYVRMHLGNQGPAPIKTAVAHLCKVAIIKYSPWRHLKRKTLQCISYYNES